MAQSREFFKSSSYMSAANMVFLEELYDKYLQSPASVDQKWQSIFAALKLEKVPAPAVRRERPSRPISYVTPTQKIDDAEIYRARGHFLAALDPLEMEQLPTAQSLGFSSEFSKNKQIYCNHIGYEFSHLDSVEQRMWLQNRIENFDPHIEWTSENRKAVLDTLLKTEGFEQFLQLKFPTAKRFSIEGGEAAIIAARSIIKTSAAEGVEEVVLGMPHRGRISMLTQLLNKPYVTMLAEFYGSMAYPDDLDVSGDVKYHLGISNDIRFSNGKTVHISMNSNPSHLEAVNPVVIGKARAKQDRINDRERKKVMGMLLHGDASFAGQGVVVESLMMSDLPGYTTGGIAHIIVNNQIGFTANAHEICAGRYVTEIAKTTKIPIFHVNGNDIDAVLKVSKIAAEFRAKFGKDVLIDVVCYRLYGHNEIDEPRFTQPLMYSKISAMETPGKIFYKVLLSEKIINEGYYEEFKAKFREQLDQALEQSKNFKQDKADWFEGAWKKLQRYIKNETLDTATGVAENLLKEIGLKLVQCPQGFNTHKTLLRFLHSRQEAIETGKNIDWSTAEALAFGSLLVEGTKIRFSGQDCRRGTFSQRHCVLVDQKNGEEYVPLNNIQNNQAQLEIIDSFLSEFGVMGFEYGYSIADPEALTIWEAQFGDFSNGAQIIIDQFISASEQKWLRLSGLVLLLPHGYEGQGPEHSSARLERYLQLCANDNMQVVNCTTPANYFHVLRRQIHRAYRKPLIVMTPKFLLRYKFAVSELKDFVEGTHFQPVIDDSSVDPNKVRKVVLCSGKVYYDLLVFKDAQKIKDIALVRLEQYYPFPESELQNVLKKYSQVSEMVWCQEEPQNMGAWSFIWPKIQQLLTQLGLKIEIKYVGRLESASTASGYGKIHEKEQAKLVREALECV